DRDPVMALDTRLPEPVGRVVRVVRQPLQWWRESLPLRVVASTFIGSMLVLLLGGVLLMEQASDGVVAGKKQAAVSEAQAAINSAQETLYATGATNSNIDLILNQLAV